MLCFAATCVHGRAVSPACHAGVRPPHLSPDEVRQGVAVLACLARLCASPEVAEAFMEAPTAIGRLFSCLACEEEALATEAARLVLRLWAPHAAKTGAGAQVVQGKRSCPHQARAHILYVTHVCIHISIFTALCTTV